MYVYEYANLNSANAGECLDFEERWCVVKDCDKVDGLNNERQAIIIVIEDPIEFLHSNKKNREMNHAASVFILFLKIFLQARTDSTMILI